MALLDGKTGIVFGALDAIELTGGSSFQNPMYLFRGEAPIREMAAAFPQPIRTGFKLFGKKFLPEYPFEEAYFLPYARQFRDALRMPLILLGGINRLDTIDRRCTKTSSSCDGPGPATRTGPGAADAGGPARGVALRPLQQVHANHLRRDPLRSRPCGRTPGHALRSGERSAGSVMVTPVRSRKNSSMSSAIQSQVGRFS